MNNQAVLLSYLQTQLALDNETAGFCASLFSFAEYRAGTQIIRVGEMTDSMQLILKGFVRAYYTEENGCEITKCFAKEFEWCGFYSYLSDESSPFSVESLEETVAACIKTQDIRMLSTKSPVMQEKINTLINKAFISVDKKNYAFANKEAKERYLDFAKENPEIVRRAKQEHIASYLGITPSSLSRLKREMKVQ